MGVSSGFKRSKVSETVKTEVCMQISNDLKCGKYAVEWGQDRGLYER